MDKFEETKKPKKELNLDNKTLVIIGLCVFIVCMWIFPSLFSKTALIFNSKPETTPNLRLVDELDTKKQYDRNSPEWLAIHTGELGEMLTNGTIKADEVVEELISLATSDSAELLKKRKDDYILSMHEYLKLIKQLDEKVVTTRYSVPIYLNDNECYIERAQYFKKLTLHYKQNFRKENGIWRIVSDEPSNEFSFKE